MFTFSIFPFGFGFLFPLIFFIVFARVASGLFRRVNRGRSLPDEYDDSLGDRFRSLERRSDSTTEARLFKLAYRLKGRLTVSDIVVETGLGVHEAESLVQGMVDGTHVLMEVDDRGIVTYEFPEIIRRFES